jgi:hypothetical protein
VDAPPAGLAAPHDADPETGKGGGVPQATRGGIRMHLGHECHNCGCGTMENLEIIILVAACFFFFFFFFAFLFWWEEDVDPGAVAACSVLTRCSMICRTEMPGPGSFISPVTMVLHCNHSPLSRSNSGRQ